MKEEIRKAGQEAVAPSNFMQWFKLKAWVRGFKGENELDDLAMEIWDYFKN